MAGRLAGKVALISGGATGAGGAASKLFAAEGARVAVVDINVAAGQAVVAEIVQSGGDAAFFEADVSDRAQIERAIAGTNARFGTISVLFNHAGTIIVKPFLDTSDDDFDRLMDVNVKSMFMMTRAVLPQMLDAGKGSIVCTASISSARLNASATSARAPNWLPRRTWRCESRKLLVRQARSGRTVIVRST